ncbi:MAG: HD domain-containing protein [Deltaproteobacteria bacterium]|nr:HD domain-containing protein [Deltaproteobacteria bacterium]
MKHEALLFELRSGLDLKEREGFSPQACLSSEAIRDKAEPDIDRGHRQNFSVDADRILHSLAYSRYIDKTQVFYLIKHDHITHRVLHVQLVSKIARNVGRLLRLNEDLVEAIALGHDIGHAPFGHDGETFLSELCKAHGIGAFLHNVQSVRFLQEIERKGRGWNLTLQVLDGIFCHDGEIHTQSLTPVREKSFSDLYAEMEQKRRDISKDVRPMTLEGCVVRMADTISYVGRDIEDAIRLGIITRKDLPLACTRVLGDTNGTIVYTLVQDLIYNSLKRPFVRFSEEVGTALRDLKGFSRNRIYNDPRVKAQTGKIKLMFELLFERYLEDLRSENDSSDIYKGFLDGMSGTYVEKNRDAEIVRDFIAGMTDDYFLKQCHKYLIPIIKSEILS